MIDWISIEEQLPAEGGFDLYLVRVRGSSCPAMAVFVGPDLRGQAMWKVQPLFAAWYATDTRVTHWALIEDWRANKDA